MPWKVTVTVVAFAAVPVTVTFGFVTVEPLAGAVMATVGAAADTVKVEEAWVLLVVPFVETAVTVYVPLASGPGTVDVQLPPVTVTGP
ncbi:hypothetical protein COEX109129_12120 [Corallococcus exiguus]